MKNKLHTKKRSYYLNYYKNEDQSNIVELIESKANAPKNKITIFEEDLPALIKLLQDLRNKIK